MDQTHTLAFLAQWDDPISGLMKKFKLLYITKDNGVAAEIELFDMEKRKVFMKAVPYPDVTLKDIFIGSKVTIYARQYLITGYADELTKRQMDIGLEKFEHTLCVSLPVMVLARCNEAGLSLCHLKTVRMSDEDAMALTHDSSFAFGLSVAVEVMGKDPRSILSAMAGLYVPSTSSECDSLFNNVFGSDPLISAAEPTATMLNSTCMVIKPHCVKSGNAGHIIQLMADEGYDITAAEVFFMDRTATLEFLEVYNTVCSEYSGWCDELSSGLCLALEICGEGVVKMVREIAGPHDVEIAKAVRPDSIRAKYGIDKIRNAVHVTDLEEDASFELEYFFKILQKTADRHVDELKKTLTTTIVPPMKPATWLG